MNDETIARIVALWEDFKRTPFPDIKNQKYWTVRNWTSKKKKRQRSLKYQCEEIEWFTLVSVYIDIDEHMRGLATYGTLYARSWRVSDYLMFGAIRLERYIPKLRFEAKDYFDDMRAVVERIVREVNANEH